MSARNTAFALILLMVAATLSWASESGGKMPITTSSPQARAEYEAGIALLERVQRDLARPHFERAVELDPDFIMAWLGLARSQARIKNTQEVMDKVIAMIETCQVSEAEQLVLGSLVAGRNGDRDTPEANTRKLASMYPGDERLQRALGDLHYGKSEYAEAVVAYEKGLQANSNYVPIYNILGYTYRALGEMQKAEKTLQKAIQLEPENPNAYDSYAELLLKLGRYQESIDTYEKALEVDPLFPSAVMGVASNLMHLERHEEARARLQKVYDIAPHDGIRSGVFWALAVTYCDQQQFDQALEELQNNYELSRKIADTGSMAIDLINMGTVLMEAGRYEEANAHFAQALELRLQADRPERVKNMMRAYGGYQECRVAVRSGDLQRAEELAAAFAKAVEELDGGPGMLRSVHELNGMVALAQSHFDVAVAELQQANAVTALNMFRLAQAYEGMGDEEAARNMYVNVVEYRGGLNMGYSFVRHQAATRLAAL